MNQFEDTRTVRYVKPSDRLGSVECGRFRLTDILGRGSCGTSYHAEPLDLDHRAVVKIAHAELLASNDADRLRQEFAAELRAVGRVQHPNLVTMFGGGETFDGLPTVAMALASGRKFEDLLLAYPSGLPLKLLRPVFKQLVSALAALHEAGVVHRDLSPRNVIMDIGAGGRPRITLMDSGVAMIKEGRRGPPEATESSRHTAPEQRRGLVSPASDMYSLGTLLWWALTGQEYSPELLATNDLFGLTQHAPADPRQVAPRVPARLAFLVGRLLSPEPEERPTAAQFLEQWSSAVDEMDRSMREAARGRPRDFGARGRSRSH